MTTADEPDDPHVEIEHLRQSTQSLAQFWAALDAGIIERQPKDNHE